MKTDPDTSVVYITGARVILRPLLEKDFTLEYLNWLNDPRVNRYSQRRPFPVGCEEMKQYNDFFLKNPRKGFVLAIIDKKRDAHIGNISLVNIQPVHRCAEIAILIGARAYWNRGYGAECIYLLTKHAFTHLNLHKILAGSFNPAFVKCVEKLGWTREGEFRERIWSHGRYHNQVWTSILKSEFSMREIYEENS